MIATTLRSFAICTRSSEKYPVRCLEGLLAQRFGPHKLELVDAEPRNDL